MKIRLTLFTLAALCVALVVHAAPLPQTQPAPRNVDLDYFRAVPDPDRIGVLLQWRTESEIDTVGFHVYRATVEGVHDPGSRLNTSLIPGCGGCPTGATYEFEDNTAQHNVGYYYWLGAVDVFNLETFFQTTEGPRPFILSELMLPLTLRQ